MNEKMSTMFHFLKTDLLYHPISNTVETAAARYALAKSIYSDSDNSKV